MVTAADTTAATVARLAFACSLTARESYTGPTVCGSTGSSWL
jgi:hypothetical protein